jgi:hypothetical protein
LEEQIKIAGDDRAEDLLWEDLLQIAGELLNKSMRRGEKHDLLATGESTRQLQ